MKKFLALLLALMMVLALTACGGEEPAADDDTAEPPVSAQGVDNEGAEINDEQLAALTEAYNEVAPLYNDMYTAAEENGWLADEQTAAEVQAVGGTLSVVTKALTEDLTVLDGSKFDELPDGLRSLIPAIEELSERVSVPYEG